VRKMGSKMCRVGVLLPAYAYLFEPLNDGRDVSAFHE
jgi:hypothetical protein